MKAGPTKIYIVYGVCYAVRWNFVGEREKGREGRGGGERQRGWMEEWKGGTSLLSRLVSMETN